MNVFKIVLLISFLSISSVVVAQNNTPMVDVENCKIVQNDLFLDGKLYASAPPILLRVYNENFEYSVVQLGKRKRSIYLYFKIFTDNVCVKHKQPLEIYFTTGEKYVLKNSFSVNCEGTAVVRLTNKDFDVLVEKSIGSFKFFTLKKDYEFRPTIKENNNFKAYLKCLKVYKIEK
ncbi:hypothetical protein [Flavobacterium sp.]|uniref:hypothetical protein n=1 Tax=Flavobacterium sp. TaxID=239 RepID=UPI003C394DC2